MIIEQINWNTAKGCYVYATTKERFPRYPRIQELIAECIAQWDYYEHPNGLHNEELLITLCVDLEAAMKSQLTQREINILFDSYVYKLGRKEMSEKYGFHAGANSKRDREKVVVRLAEYMARVHHWSEFIPHEPQDESDVLENDGCGT